MRTLSYVLVIICAICLTPKVFGQTAKAIKEEEDIKILLCQKWRLVLMETGGRSMDIPVNKASYLNFKNDGTFSDSSVRFKVTNGSWSFNKTDNVLETIENGGKSNMKIVTITFNELKTEVKYPNATMILTYKKDE